MKLVRHALLGWLSIPSIVFLLVAACTQPESTPAPTPTPTPTPISPYEKLLGLIPDTQETRSRIAINDYALIRQLFGIPLPGRDASEAPLNEYISAVAVRMPGKSGPHIIRGPWISGWHEYVEVGLSNRQYLGFDLREVDQSVLAGVPPGQLELVRGRFSPATTEAALTACADKCVPPDAEHEYQGVRFYSWGEDFATNLRKRLVPPVFDQLGRGGRIAVQNGYVLRTLGTGDMKSMIDAGLKKRASLADWEDYRLLAQGMSELGAYGMFYTDQTQGFDETVKAICQSSNMSEQDCGRVRAQVGSGPMLRRYQVFATGVGKDERGDYTALALVHADEASARDNVALLRQRIGQASRLAVRKPWVDYFDIHGIEVVARDRVLLAKLRSTEGRPPNWIEWVETRDPLLLHEPSPGFVPPTPPPTAPVTPTPTAIDADARTELRNVQAAVHALEVDNRLARIPNPVGTNLAPCAVGTKDMQAFPDVTSDVANGGKLKDPVGNSYAYPGDKPGYVLFGHDIHADGTQERLVNYIVSTTTTYCYTVDESGRVFQVPETGPAPETPLPAPTATPALVAPVATAPTSAPSPRPIPPLVTPAPQGGDSRSFALIVSADPPEGGIVAQASWKTTLPDGRKVEISATPPAVRTMPQPRQTVWAAGDEVRIVALVNEAKGFEFAGWGGDCAGTERVCVLTMDSSKEMVAHFRPISSKVGA